jgi:hypothetical protein
MGTLWLTLLGHARARGRKRSQFSFVVQRNPTTASFWVGWLRTYLCMRYRMVGPDREILLKLILNCQTSLATYVPKRVLPDHGDFPLPVPVEKTVATLFPVPSVRSWPGSRPHFWSRPQAKHCSSPWRPGRPERTVISRLP